ncbi:BTB/POZ and MATH domain-containing protein 2-like [Triticum dicoccoides]|uniref:BTB/POZ and MATH domain-containing protein 2-like n=1 Tax=Triticum dicoccoides TaxID=85692 RepID=UPI0018919F57|nr:BTB/POZ and MATH domain-containing protein 2-like [Triticum dicoccoides]
MVRNYSHTKQKLSTDNSSLSTLFTLGGYPWYIEYYPNNDNPDRTNFISLCVNGYQDNLQQEPVEVNLGFSFIDQVEKQRGRTAKEIAVRDPCLCRPPWRTAKKWIPVVCDIMVVRNKDPRTEDTTKVLLPDIDHHFNGLLQTKVDADVAFEVGGETFIAHRCVLAARSMVFMAHLFGPMKEASNNVIQIQDMEANVFKALHSFIYTDSFAVMDKNNVNMEEDVMVQVMEDGQEKEAILEDEMLLQWLQHMLVAVDRYDVQRLKCIREKQLSDKIGLSTVISALAFAEQHHCQGLKEACFKFIQV